ncbi:hypothetical protein ACPPVS_01340 [Cellulomonas sp. McL0617]|uniref:hypothetical protein n=1 Tax=Cellulomonas sp. McL0617 TaxID=3415675 RepID=UPI003CEA377F
MLTVPADTKMTGTIGEHYVASMLARHGWAPALTRDGLERTDILAVQTQGNRAMIEVQVKSARGSGQNLSWPLGLKEQTRARNSREWFVFVAIDAQPTGPVRCFVAPRDHIAAAAWIEHMHWLTEPGIAPGKRNVGPDRARSALSTFERYENRWDLLLESAFDAPVLLPPRFRDYALEDRVGLPADHRWAAALPAWG